MTTPHRATPEQWEQCASALIERLSRLEEGYDEMAARIEALHSTVRRSSLPPTFRHCSDLGSNPPAWRPLKVETTYGSEPAADAAQILNPCMVVEGTFEHGGATYRYKAPAERLGQPAPTDEARNAAMDELRAASAEAR